MAKILGIDGKGTKPATPTGVNMDMSKSKEMKCKCGDQVFMQATIFRKIPKLISNTPNDAVIPIEVYLCASCGTILDELLPPELQTKK